MLEQLALSALGVLWGFIGAYVAFKKLFKPEVVLDFSDIILEEIMNNVEYQKRIYLVGGLLGQGIRQGIGLQGTKGKFKIEDALGSLVGGFLENIAGNLIQGQPQEAPQTEGIRKTL